MYPTQQFTGSAPAHPGPLEKGTYLCNGPVARHLTSWCACQGPTGREFPTCPAAFLLNPPAWLCSRSFTAFPQVCGDAVHLHQLCLCLQQAGFNLPVAVLQPVPTLLC